MKRAISLILTAAMVMSFLCTGTFAVSFVDIEDHWAEEAIERWTSNGVVNGKGENRFDPDATLTRAEMAQIYVNLLNLTEKADISTYTDVPADAWYADAVAKCVAAGVLTGTGNSTFSPLRPITREQMFVAFGRAMGLKPSETTSSDLSDLGDVSDWAEGMVNALLNAGYVSGVGGSSLLPLNDINRASVMALLDKTVAAYGNTPGATVETEGDGGLVLVVADDVTVTGTVADVVVAQGAADSVVTLSDTTVTGTVTMAAAGARLAVMGESEVENVVVNPSAQGAGVSVGQDAMVASVVTEATDTDLSVSGTVGDVTVAETASNTTVSTEKGAKVESVTTAGADTTMSVAGTVGSVTVTESATGATVSTEKGAKVESVTTAGSGTTVEGSGTVSKVEAAEGAADTSVTTSGTKVENNSSESVTTDKGTVAAGESGTTSGGSTSSGGSSGGGGGSSGSGSSHSHSYVYTDNGDGTHTGVCSAGDSTLAPEVHDNNGTDGTCSKCDAANWALVNSAETWNDAVEAGKNIVVTADFIADTQLKITSAITVNGNNKTITSKNAAENAADSAGILVTAGATIKNLIVSGPNNNTASWDAGEYGIKVYGTTGVKLENVTVTKANAGIQVNSSEVTLAGTITVSGNEWGGIEVCKSSNENLTAGKLIIDTATIVCTDTTGIPAVWVDGTTAYDGVVVDAEDLNQIVKGSQIYYYTSGIVLDGFTLSQNITIPAGETLTVKDLTVPAGKTLTVNGTLSIAAGGSLKGAETEAVNEGAASLAVATGGSVKISGTEDGGLLIDISGSESDEMKSCVTSTGVWQLKANMEMDIFPVYTMAAAKGATTSIKVYEGGTLKQDVAAKPSNVDTYAWVGTTEGTAALIPSGKGSYVEFHEVASENEIRILAHDLYGTVESGRGFYVYLNDRINVKSGCTFTLGHAATFYQTGGKITVEAGGTLNLNSAPATHSKGGTISIVGTNTSSTLVIGSGVTWDSKDPGTYTWDSSGNNWISETDAPYPGTGGDTDAGGANPAG